MTVKNVKILELMAVFLEQLKMGVQFVDIQAIDEDTIRIIATPPHYKPDIDSNQRIA